MAASSQDPPSVAVRPLPRQTPEVGAVCGNPARTDLSGGRSAMDVPTAIEPRTSAMRSRRRSGVAAPGRCSRQPRARSAFRDPFRHLAFAALHGDLGSSLFSGQSIVSMIAQRIPPTPVADDPDPANLRVGRGASGSRRPGAGGQLDRPCGVFPRRIGLFANNATSRSSGEQPTRLSRASG